MFSMAALAPQHANGCLAEKPRHLDVDLITRLGSKRCHVRFCRAALPMELGSEKQASGKAQYPQFWPHFLSFRIIIENRRV